MHPLSTSSSSRKRTRLDSEEDRDLSAKSLRGKNVNRPHVDMRTFLFNALFLLAIQEDDELALETIDKTFSKELVEL